MAEIASRTFESILKEVITTFNVESLKPEQDIIVKSMLSKRDCLAVLPTGYGKSLPYQIYIPLVRELKKYEAELDHDRAGYEKFQFGENEKVVVCCPLLALMEDQVKRLETVPGLRVGYKGSSPDVDAKIKSGEIDLIFASPESLVGDAYWRAQMQQLAVGIIVIDEFHTITTWGGDEEIEEHSAFRKWFRCIGELRALFPKASILALSATCTIKIKTRVMKMLNLKMESTTILSVSPNKSNVKLLVKQIDNDITSSMFWLLDNLQRLKENFPKLLIYANSITDVAKLYNYMVTEVPECRNYLEMFHSETPERKKTSIIQALCKENSSIRIVFATSALGMGIDVKDCNGLILFGPPKNVVDLVQEIGRVGRNGKLSCAVMMFNSQGLRNVEEDIKTIYRENKCRRKLVMQNFLQESELQELSSECDKHTCCDVCSQKCACGNCEQLDIEKMVNFIQLQDNSGSEESDTDMTEPYEYLLMDDDDLLAELEDDNC